MEKLRRVLQEIVILPLFYLCWILATVSFAAMELTDSTASHVCSFIAILFGLVASFQLLKQLRIDQLGKRDCTAWDIFWLFFSYRLKLFVVSLPFIALAAYFDWYSEISQKLRLLEQAPLGDKLARLHDLIVAGWIPAIPSTFLIFLDLAGAAVVLAQGDGERFVRNALRVLRPLAAPLVLLLLAELALYVAENLVQSVSPGLGWLAVLGRTMTLPFSLLVDAGGKIFLAWLILERNLLPAESFTKAV